MTIKTNNRPVAHYLHIGILAAALLFWPSATLAVNVTQEIEPADTSENNNEKTPGADARNLVYPREFFDRFAPSTAHDILLQLPSFTIQEVSQDRGLGQASENILINSRRVSDKSGGAVSKLKQIPANQVQRVEIVDAATLNIPGLTGQIANFVVEMRQGQGRFEWSPSFLQRYVDANPYRGSVSYAGVRNSLTYTLSLVNNAVRSGLGGGSFVIKDAQGAISENRLLRHQSASDAAALRGDFEYEHPSGSTSHVLIEHMQVWSDVEQHETRQLIGQPEVRRQIFNESDPRRTGIQMDHTRKMFGGDVKLILVSNTTDQPVDMEEFTQIEGAASGLGTRFVRAADTRERVARMEHERLWNKTALTFSIERAENKLQQTGALYVMDADGSFQPVDYPAGTGGVQEVRYELMAGARRLFGPTITTQFSLGAERSRLQRTVGDTPSSQFFRPKGSVSLAWNHGKGRSLTGTLTRKVGQISFFDYLSQPNFEVERERLGNPDLVPPQSWEFDLQYAIAVHPALQVRSRAYYKKIEDLVDVIPIGDSGSGIGNIPSARQWGGEAAASVDFSTFGFTGARLDARYLFGISSLTDPVTDEKRPIGGALKMGAQLNFRHDLKTGQWAWGTLASYQRTQPRWYWNQISHGREGATMVHLFVERKNIGPLTLRVTLLNMTQVRYHYDRVVYAGSRREAEVMRQERQRSEVGRGLKVTLTGTF